MVSGEYSGTLEAKCDELGTFTYTVNAIITPASPEEVVKFKTELGDSTSRSVNFKNNFTATIELSAKVLFTHMKIVYKKWYLFQFESPVFSLDKPICIPANHTGKFSVTFDPTEMGIVQSKLIVTSPQTGDYMWV